MTHLKIAFHLELKLQKYFDLIQFYLRPATVGWKDRQKSWLEKKPWKQFLKVRLLNFWNYQKQFSSNNNKCLQIQTETVLSWHFDKENDAVFKYFFIFISLHSPLPIDAKFLELFSANFLFLQYFKWIIILSCEVIVPPKILIITMLA